MANKFTKSVLERQAKELAHAAAPQPPEDAAKPAAKAPAPKKKTAVPPQVVDPQLLSVQSAEVEPQEPAPRVELVVPDLGDYIVRGEARIAKNKTFYLDLIVIDAIRAAAAAQNVTDSKLVNDILRKILGV